MKKIKLTRGKYALVDDEDYSLLSEHKWYCTNNGYAQHDVYKLKKKVLMHRFLLGVKKGYVVDHINGNPLDNRRINLRVCSQSQNMANSRLSKASKSGFKGVSWDKKCCKWGAYLTKDYKHIFLGYFDEIKDAANAYNKRAESEFGNFAKLNKTDLC